MKMQKQKVGFILEVEYDLGEATGMNVADALGLANELIEKARECGTVKLAKVNQLPSEIILEKDRME